MPNNNRNQFGAARPDAHYVRADVEARYGRFAIRGNE